MRHEVTVDEDFDRVDGDTMFRAYCTDECGWAGERWHHADEYEAREDVPPTDLAYAAAEAEGNEHLEGGGV